MDEIKLKPTKHRSHISPPPKGRMKQHSATNVSRSQRLTIYASSCAPVTSEEDCALALTEGAIPNDLHGTLYRNGPGRFAVGRDRYSHPFDGDGMISSFRFDGRSVRYRNAYVKTAEFQAEELRGRTLYRSFGTNRPGGLLQNALRTKFKNAANTGVISHGGRLLALWEGGWPHELDHDTLETRSRFGYAGRLQNPFGALDRLLNPELPFSAHPKVDPVSGKLYNFGLAFGVKNRLLIYTVNPNGEMDPIRFVNLDKLSFIHDFVITETSKAIFFCSPVHFDVLSMLTGRKTPAAGIAGDPFARVRILVVDLNAPPGEISRSHTSVFEAPYSFVFHHINAFERDGEVHLFSSEMGDFPSAEAAQEALTGGEVEYPLTRLVHYVLRPGQRNAIRNPLNVRAFEMPRVRDIDVGRSFEHFYATGAESDDLFPFMDEVLKISTTGAIKARFQLEEGLAGEPVYAPTPRGGYVLSLCCNHLTKKSELIVLEPHRLKTVARLSLPHSQPLGFHGNWVAGLSSSDT